MSLTRAMKEVWLVGGLDTLDDGNAVANGEGEDGREVMRALLKGLTGRDVRIDAVNGDGAAMEVKGTEKTAESTTDGEDVEGGEGGVATAIDDNDEGMEQDGG